MMLEEFIGKLQERLSQPLPGEEAQMKMASQFRRARILEELDKSKARLGSVLISIYPHQDEIYTVLMKRPSYKGVHSGQVSFPGGKHEDGDDDLFETALREAHEEVGIVPDNVRVIGALSELYIPPSNFLVLPVVGTIEKRPDLIPDIHEVETIIETPIKHFFGKNTLREGEIPVGDGYRIKSPYFEIQGHVVWGATAMIISELVHVMREIARKNKISLF